MAKWNEQKLRLNQNLEVSTLVNDKVLDKYRYYIGSIFDIVKFLVVNELPFRGSYDEETHSEKGLFQALFKFTLQKDKQLAEYAKIIPKNALYTSPEIQNDIINIMACCVKKQVAEEIMSADVPFFCVMADGTRDPNNVEAISIAFRFVRRGVAHESLLTIEEANELNAEYLANLILSTLRENNINPENLLCQCYDGASVMRGYMGGVQALIEKKLSMRAPYVHCFNHQLHLIIVFLVKNISEVKQYFDYCSLIHKIFSTFKFKSYYNGDRTSRLLDQRWTGHLKVTEIVFKNYTTMIEALNSAIANEFTDFDGNTVVECTGLLAAMKSRSFRFILCVMLKVLRTIEPADKTLQHRETGLGIGLPVVLTVAKCVQDLRSTTAFEEVFQQCTALLEEDEGADLCNTRGGTHGSKRKIKPTERYADFVLTESSGIYQREQNIDDAHYEQIYFEIIDTISNEMERRFVEKQSLYSVIDKIFSFSFDKIDELQELFDLNRNIPMPTPEEVVCVKNYFKENNILKENYLKELYKQRLAFKKTYELYATAATFGCSSSICEASFSSMKRVVTPYRQSMLFGRESNLTLLPFERKKTEAIGQDIFLRKFHEKSRRLPLF